MPPGAPHVAYKANIIIITVTLVFVACNLSELNITTCHFVAKAKHNHNDCGIDNCCLRLVRAEHYYLRLCFKGDITSANVDPDLCSHMALIVQVQIIAPKCKGTVRRKTLEIRI